jgi:hypothetical protein
VTGFRLRSALRKQSSNGQRVKPFSWQSLSDYRQHDTLLGVSIGVAPACPYGYYDTAPYGCAPTGYYGPEWFNGDGFIGAGPWFHGASDFQGNVNNRLHPAHGYTGATPKAGEKAEPSKRIDSAHFQGNETRDGRGNVTPGKK